MHSVPTHAECSSSECSVGKRILGLTVSSGLQSCLSTPAFLHHSPAVPEGSGQPFRGRAGKTMASQKCDSANLRGYENTWDTKCPKMAAPLRGRQTDTKWCLPMWGGGRDFLCRALLPPGGLIDIGSCPSPEVFSHPGVQSAQRCQLLTRKSCRPEMQVCGAGAAALHATAFGVWLREW